MKAIINIEFFISVMVFLGTVFFLIVSVANNVPQLHQNALLSSLRSKTYSASELLLLDEGAPKSWNSANVQRIGLSAGQKYVLSLQKINELKALCSADYEKARDAVTGDARFSVMINITDIETGEVYASCIPAAQSLVMPLSEIRRYAILENGNRVSMDVTIG